MENVQPINLDFLVDLATKESLHNGKTREFIKIATKEACINLHAQRASFWYFQKDFLTCMLTYHHSEDPFYSRCKPIEANRYSTLYRNLSSQYITHITIENPQDRLQTKSNSFLLRRNTATWLSAQVWCENKPIGVISIEWDTPIQDIYHYKFAIITLASISGQSYDALLRVKEYEIRKEEINEAADAKIDNEKDQLIKKLKDHAFYTSHSVRHPVTTMLALIDLIDINWENREKYSNLLQQIKIQAMNLDEVIHVMTAKIELD